MSKTQTVDKKIVARKFFNDDKEVMPMPELIEIQKVQIEMMNDILNRIK